MLFIDGSQGEGGGQVIRSAVALSILTATPISVTHVRAGRKKPGLLRQHLTAVKAAAQISNAHTEGVTLGSQAFRFEPAAPRSGRYHFAIGTAGSTMLVLQTILYPLLAADGPSEVVIEGGTHNPKAPTFEFIQRTFLPLLERMGLQVKIRLARRGYIPVGGGRLEIEVTPNPNPQPLHLRDGHDKGELTAQAWVAELPAKIGHQQLTRVGDMLSIPRERRFLHQVNDAIGAGNSFEVSIADTQVTETFTAIGEIKARSRHLATDLAREAKAFLAAGVPVGEHLADQLLIPIALAGDGSFYTVTPSLHTHTNIRIIEQFLPVRFQCDPVREDAYRIAVSAR